MEQDYLYLHNSHVVSSVQLDVVHLGDEDGGDGDKERGAVHVDRGADGKNKLTNSFVDTSLLQTLETDGQSCCSVRR